jgi:hypothetical protein
VTNVITEATVWSINFDGTNLTKRLYLDVTTWQGCPHCVIAGMALSPSAGSGALYVSAVMAPTVALRVVG